MPPDRMQHSKVGNLSFAAFLIIEARRKGMQSKKSKKNMIHCRLSRFCTLERKGEEIPGGQRFYCAGAKVFFHDTGTKRRGLPRKGYTK